MFNYAPTVNDNSGQIYGQYQLQGAQSLAQGMNQGSTGISDAIKQMNQIKMQQQVAQGALGAAQGLVDKGYMDQATLDKLNALPPLQQIGAAQNILPMLNAAGMMDYHKSLIDMRSQSLAQKGAAASSKATGIMPWNSTPAPGGLGGSGSGGSSDDSSQ
jgi:hypothetical protein